jgi:hypothetical protein
MPIEFRCTNCNRLLRTQDDTAGKQAECPGCGAVAPIPAKGDTAPAQAVLDDPLSEPSLTPPVPPLTGFSPPGIDRLYSGEPAAANPYQSPAYNMSRPVWPDMPRSGPPWERDRTFRSLFETLQMLYSSPGFFFSDMRREGGLGRPVAFAVIASSTGMFVQVALQTAIQFAIMAFAMANDPNFPIAAMGPAAGMAMAVVLIPLVVLIWLFLQSGMYHLMLKMLGAAPFPFETTLRVVAYSMGAAFLLAAIPMCGHFIAWIASVVFAIIGLSKAQQISGGKASAAVLIPVGVCCGSTVAFYISMIMMILSQA